MLHVTTSVQRLVFLLNLKQVRTFNHTHGDPNVILNYVFFTSLTHDSIKKGAMDSLDKTFDNFWQHSTADKAISNYRINNKLERAL